MTVPETEISLPEHLRRDH